MKKENVFKGLVAILDSFGHEVRREALKQGHGWRVMSGACTADAQSMIFVDKRLSQDEQINFLVTKIVSLGLSLTPEQVQDLPERIQEQFLEAQAA